MQQVPQIQDHFINKQVALINLLEYSEAQQLYQDLRSYQITLQEEIKNTPNQQIDPTIQLDFGVILNLIPTYRKYIGKLLQTLNPILKDSFYDIIQFGIDENDFLAFFLDYNANSSKNNHIEFHRDESYLTINICLRKPDNGGNLIFQDQYGDEKEVGIGEGKAICHYGDLLHSTQPFNHGNRASLIIYTLVNHNHLNRSFYESTYLPYLNMKTLNTSNIHFDVASIPECCRKIRNQPDKKSKLSQNMWTRILGYLSPFENATKCTFVCYTWYHIIKSLPYQTIKNPNQKLSKLKFQEWKQRTQSFRNMSGQNSIFSFHTGGAGIRIGHQMWRMLSYNHLKQGIVDYPQNIFTQQQIDKENVLVPNAIFIDNNYDDAAYRNIQYNNLQEINKYIHFNNLHQSYKYLYNSNLMFSQPIADYYQLGQLDDKKNLDLIFEQIRLNIEKQDMLDAFFFTHSLSGKSTTPINHFLYDHLKMDFNRKIFNFAIFPNYPVCNNFVTALQDKYPQTPYYSLLNCNDLLNYSDGYLAFNNQAIHKFLLQNFEYPMIDDFNKIIGSELYNLIDMVTNQSQLNIQELFQNLIPHPSLKLLGCHSAPYQFKIKQQKGGNSVAENVNSVFETNNNFTGLNTTRGKYIAVTLNFKGDVLPKDVMAAICTLKTRRSINFIDWAPTGFKCSIQYTSTNYLPDYQIIPPKSNVTNIYNTTESGNYYDQIIQQSLQLSNKNAYLQHFNQDNIYESQENLKMIFQDYLEAETEEQQE